MRRGWIRLHRKMADHWLYQEERTFSKYEAWVDLLLMVNHAANKVLMDGQIIYVERGECITSTRKLCAKWDWSNTKLANFLTLLEQENMIIVKSDSKKTRIKIIQYDTYQKDSREKKTNIKQSESRGTPEKRTNNNVNNVKNEKNDHTVYTKNAFDQILPRYQMGF